MALRSPRFARTSPDQQRGSALAACVLALVLASPALAVGGGDDGGTTGFSNSDTSPGQKAILEYKTGERRLERAREMQQQIVEARAAGDEKRVAKLEKDAAGMYARAEKYFGKALEYDEDLYQAWSSLGYTLRHLDRWDEALAAYDRAVALEPRYAEAVEYRAEAYLELGRLEDAKAGYVQLVTWVRPMADRLMAKMETWVEARTAEPGDVDPAQIAALASWIVERKEQDGAFEPFSAADRATW